MGRECRRVPADWQHPRNEQGRYIPLFDEDYQTAAAEWMANCLAWHDGTHKDLVAGHTTKEKHQFYWDWAGQPPDEESYRQKWTTEPTHYQMYEDTSEGTPISPVFATPEELARWLADNGASAFAGMTASYEAWLNVCRGNPSISAVIDANGWRSGVEAAMDTQRETH
jgi:hypothetical protein